MALFLASYSETTRWAKIFKTPKQGLGKHKASFFFLLAPSPLSSLPAFLPVVLLALQGTKDSGFLVEF